MYRSLFIVVALAMTGCDGKNQTVRVDGRAVQLRLAGRGVPTVVFESGAGSIGLKSWTKVQPEVAQFASTITYDRAGSGRSEPGVEPRDALRVAAELHAVLESVKAVPPYVLVGHSSGAHYIRMFAHAYPQEVAGLVFVDPATEQIHDWFEVHVPNEMKARVDPSKMPPGARGEWHARHLTAEQVRSAPLPAHLPAVVLSSTRSEPDHLPGFLEAVLISHKELASKMTNAKHVLTGESGHNIPEEQPRLVVKAVQEIVEKIRH